MPSSSDAIELMHEKKIEYGPAKAANAGAHLPVPAHAHLVGSPARRCRHFHSRCLHDASRSVHAHDPSPTVVL